MADHKTEATTVPNETGPGKTPVNVYFDLEWSGEPS